MDLYVRECHKEVRSVSTPTASVDTETPVSPHRFPVTFNLSCQHKYRNWVILQDSMELEFLSEDEAPVVTKSIQYYKTEETTFSKDQLHKRLFRGLQDLSVPSTESYEVSKTISSCAWDSGVEGRGVNLKVDFSFVVLHKHILDENQAIHLATQQSMQQEVMVPATDASIESLKSCEVMDCSGESCRICLEDFEATGNCQRVAMPCSHVFHQDCIQTWLKVSHYCPICRYQMPTD